MLPLQRGADMTTGYKMNEKQLYNLKEFIAQAKHELDEYEKEWQDANDHHRASHTWNEWWGTLHRYWSW